MIQLAIVRSDGSPVTAGAALEAGQTYYAEMPMPGRASGGQSIEIVWDNTAIATVTAEGTNRDASLLSPYTSGWSSQSPSPFESVTIAGGTASSYLDSWSNSHALRMRIKILMGATGGVVTLFATVKV